MYPRSVKILMVVCLVAVTAVAVASFAAASPAAPGAKNYLSVATDLNNPRGIVFGPDGALYVAEAGSGGDSEPCVDGPEGKVCLGETGAVTRAEAGSQSVVADGFVSLANPDDGGSATGPHDVAFDADGNLMVLIGLGADPALRDPAGPLGAFGENFGQLARVDENGDWTNVVDIAAYEAANNPDGGEIDSNPYSLIAIEDGFVVADAGANALLHVAGDGTISTLAVFADRMVEFPPGSGDMIPMQAVPTSVALGPDGDYYVGQLTGFPFPPGGANIYRVPEEGGDPEVYLEGFTNIIDLTFDEDGNLYVLEMFKNGALSGDPTGNLIKVLPDGTRITLASGSLFTPSSVEMGPDGYLYVSNKGTLSEVGEVICLAANPQIYMPVVR